MAGVKTGATKAGTKPAPRGALDLKRATDLWLAGEWPLLAARDAELIADDSDRGLTAAYVASAHHFCDAHDLAHAWAERAIEWGCPRPYLGRVLSSGAHVTLARMAAIAGDLDRARAHIARTSDPIGGEEAEALCDARLSGELARLGLLQTSADVMGDDLERLIDEPIARVSRHRLTVLKSEMRRVRQLLAQHHARGQLGSRAGAEPASDAEIAKQGSVSQLGQDLWVLERTGYKRGGYFVEFGATDGVLLSNTFLLETAFDWTGLLAEPNPEYFAELKENRKAKALDACITGRTGETVEFILADEFGGIKDYIGRDHHAPRRQAYAELTENTVTLDTISLDDFLRQNKAPKAIDYISVDTEGNERDILSAFPFDKWDVAMWTVEHNFTEDRDAIFELMQANGYARKSVDFDDWYYKSDGEPA